MDGALFGRGMLYGLALSIIGYAVAFASAGVHISTLTPLAMFIVYGVLGWVALPNLGKSVQEALGRGFTLGFGAAVTAMILGLILHFVFRTGPALPLPLFLVVLVIGEVKFAAATAAVARWRFNRSQSLGS